MSVQSAPDSRKDSREHLACLFRPDHLKTMDNDRKRVSLDDLYAYSLGLSIYCFARCEWDAVWCCEKLQPGYINTIEPKRKTAGVIAQDLVALVDMISDHTMKAICRGPAAEFQRLVQERNGLLHGKPGTATNGDQRLFRHGAELTVAAVNNLSDKFTACQINLNHLMHSRLSLADGLKLG